MRTARQHKSTRINRPSRPSIEKRMRAIMAFRPSIQQIRRIQMVAIVMIVLGAALWIRDLIVNPQHWPIERVDIQGDLRYLSEEKLQTVIQKYIHTNLYQLNSVNLERDLETMPWVKEIKLRKSWPQDLIIYVTEHRPVAYWGEEQLLDQYGEVFDGVLPEDRADFPKLYSPENKGREMGERYLQVLNWLKEVPLRLTALREDSRGSWVIDFEEGLQVNIGVHNQEKRLKRFVVGYQAILSKRLEKISRVDLRYTNGFAVEWK